MEINSFLSLTLLAQTRPEIDGMYFVLLASRVLHMIGAAILLGGLIYVRHVIKPASPAGPTETADALFGGKRARWAQWVGIATFLLLLSGLFNYFYFRSSLEKLPAAYHALIGIKMLLSFAMFFIAALLAGKTALAERLREKFYFWLTICVLLGISIVILGGMLRTFPRTPKNVNVEASVVSPAVESTTLS
jgi:uncharacterized membrane protein